MTINILKKDDGKIYFTLNDQCNEFNYEGLDKFIELFYSNNNEVNIECDEEFNEYKQLLNSILLECRKEDYVNAVKEAIKSQEEIDKLTEFDEINKE